MAIKYTKALKETNEMIEALDYRILLLKDAYERTQQLEFQQWLKERSHRRPIGNTRLIIQRKILRLEAHRNILQKQVDDYCNRRKQKIIKDCYSIIDKDTVSVFIYVNRAVKEKKLFSYPYRGDEYFDSAQFIDKTLEEAEEIVKTKFQSKEK